MNDTHIKPTRGVSPNRAAERLDVSRKTIDRMIAAGEIRAARVSARRLSIPESEIERILAGDPVAA